MRNLIIASLFALSVAACSSGGSGGSAGSGSGGGGTSQLGLSSPDSISSIPQQ